MIKYLTSEEKKLSRDLWEEAFWEDSRQFDDYYYKEKVKENRILALIEDAEVSAAELSDEEGDLELLLLSDGSQLNAMVQLNPYLLQVRDCRWQVDYLVGVATRREKRHRGYMRRLLVQMMTDMKKEKAPFCFLMPAAEAIYRPFGFTYIFNQPRWQLKKEAQSRLERKPANAMEQTAAAWMMNWLQSRYQVYAVRDEAYVKRLMEELASEEGKLEALYDGHKLVGFQAMWGLTKKEQRLLYAESFYLEEIAEPKPAIMARIIAPEEFVKAIRLKKGKTGEITVNLWLEDPLIPQNEGLWLWQINQETSKLTKEQELLPGQPSVRLTVTELTEWLFGYRVPEAAEELDQQLDTLCGVFLDEVV